MHTVDVINRKHNALCAQIEHKISEVLLRRGDYSLVGELGSLKDRLTAVPQEATMLKMYSLTIRKIDRRYSRGGRDPSLTRSNTACSNVDGRSVVACGQDTNGSSPTRLAALEVPRVDSVNDQRSVDIDLSQSLTEIIASVHGVQRDPQQGINVISTHTDAWMHAMKIRQKNYEEQLSRFQKNLVTMSIAVQGAESVYEDLQGDIEVLKSNSTEVWQRLRTDEIRMDNIDRSISSLEDKVKENLETVNEWFADLVARLSQSKIPREIVNSLQEIINDSSPGVAVDRMRNEIRELRDSMATSRYATEGLRGLVVNLSDQVSNVPPTQMIRDESLILREDINTESNRRECEIVRKGIERTEKQLRQLIRNEIQMDSVDISLIKKYSRCSMYPFSYWEYPKISAEICEVLRD